MTLGYAIPTYKGHIDLLPRLLGSIARSTVSPDVVSVSMSECTWTPSYNYPFELVLTGTEKRQNPSQNLNKAIAKLDTDLITVIGSDDMVHPQRNSFLKKAFRNPDVNAVVHDFKLSDMWDDFFMTMTFDTLELYVNYIDTIRDNIPYPVSRFFHYDFANGFITCRKEVFERFEYDESKEAEFIEDSLFNATIVKHGINISYIKNKLALYCKNKSR